MEMAHGTLFRKLMAVDDFWQGEAIDSDVANDKLLGLSRDSVRHIPTLVT